MTDAEVIDSMLDRLSGWERATPRPLEISQELIVKALRERDELVAALRDCGNRLDQVARHYGCLKHVDRELTAARAVLAKHAKE